MRALMKDNKKNAIYTQTTCIVAFGLVLTQSKEVIDFSDDSERNAK